MNGRSGLIGTIIFLAVSAFAQNPGVSVNVVNPWVGAIIGDRLNVDVRVTSTYELSLVRATLESFTTNLVYGGTSWTNVFDTTSFARGSYTLNIVAQDVFGNIGQAQRTVRVDRPPVLNVRFPINGTVARSNLYVSVSANDDDPVGVRISGYNRGDVLFTATNSVERLIPAITGTLSIEAVDSSNQKTVAPRTIYIETSTNLVEAISAPGPLLDFSGSRLLYVSIPDPPQPPAATAQLLDLSSGLNIGAPALWTDYPIPGEYYKPIAAWVSATSAVVVYDTPLVPEYTLALQGSNFSVVAYGYSPAEVVNGKAIIGAELYDFNKSLTGCSVNLGFPPGRLDLAETDIVFLSADGVFRSRPTDPTNICAREITLVSSKVEGRLPVTDGINVAFCWHSNIIANINGQDEVLATWPPGQGHNMQVAASGGWIAFTKPGTMNQIQVWTRSPAGHLEQRTFYSVSSFFESLNSDGSVTFQVFGGPPPGRYLSVPNAQPIWIDSGQGRVKWEEGDLFVMIGRSAFRVAMGNLRVYRANSQAIGLELRSPNGLRYLLQESSDLLTWSNRATITNVTGMFSQTNGVTTSGAMFYRALLLP